MNQKLKNKKTLDGDPKNLSFFYLTSIQLTHFPKEDMNKLLSLVYPSSCEFRQCKTIT